MPITSSDLPLYYKDEPNRVREVAAFVRSSTDSEKWICYARGNAVEALNALDHPRAGYVGGIHTIAPADVRFVLDQPSWERGLDYPSLVWDGERLTVDEFRRWVTKHLEGT